MQLFTSETQAKLYFSLMRTIGGMWRCILHASVLMPLYVIYVFHQSCFAFICHPQLWWSNRHHGSRLPTINWGWFSRNGWRGWCCCLLLWYCQYQLLMYMQKRDFSSISSVLDLWHFFHSALSGQLYFFHEHMQYEYSYTARKVIRIQRTNSILNCWWSGMWLSAIA